MVEWKKLGEVCSFKRGQIITSKTAVEGDIPVIAGGQTPSYYHNEFNRDGESITVAGSGAYAGYICYWNQPIFVSDAFTIDPIDTLKYRYLFYWLKMNQGNVYAAQKGAGVPHVHGKDIANFQIPIPSLQEQTRIVTILDTFTSAIDNLKDQIAQRRKQYEFYRDQLFNLKDKEGVTFTTVGNACRTVTPPIKYGKKFYSRKGSFPIIDQGQTKIVGYTNEEKDVLPSDEYVLFGDHTRIVKYYNGRFAQGADGLKILKANKGILPKFLFFAFDSVKIPNKGYSRHWSFAKELQIPIPFLSDQHRIVANLDTFEDSIANLEAQLKEREKQYEYYRNKLLTFE